MLFHPLQTAEIVGTHSGMIRKVASLAACLILASPVCAQMSQDNPFREMAQRFAEIHDYMQDAQYQGAFDAYFDCYEKAVLDGKPPEPASQASSDSLFHAAYVKCAPLRDTGISLANERILAFHADMQAAKRTAEIDRFRRILAVLRLGKPFARIGLRNAYGDYLGRTEEY